MCLKFFGSHGMAPLENAVYAQDDIYFKHCAHIVPIYISVCVCLCVCVCVCVCVCLCVLVLYLHGVNVHVIDVSFKTIYT